MFSFYFQTLSFIFIGWVCGVCLHGCLHNLHSVLMEIRRGHWMFWNWNADARELPCGCWEFACLCSAVLLLMYPLGFVTNRIC